MENEGMLGINVYGRKVWPDQQDFRTGAFLPCLLLRMNQLDRVFMLSDMYIYSVVILGFGYIIFMGIRLAIYGNKLNRYLIEHHTEQWKEMTTVLGFGPGLSSSKGFKFIFSKEHFGDPEVLRLKVIFRNASIYMVLGAIGTFFMFAIVVALVPYT